MQLDRPKRRPSRPRDNHNRAPSQGQGAGDPFAPQDPFVAPSASAQAHAHTTHPQPDPFRQNTPFAPPTNAAPGQPFASSTQFVKPRGDPFGRSFQGDGFGRSEVGFGISNVTGFGRNDATGFGQKDTTGFGQKDTMPFGQKDAMPFGQKGTMPFEQRNTGGFGQPSTSFAKPDAAFPKPDAAPFAQQDTTSFPQPAPAFAHSEFGVPPRREGQKSLLRASASVPHASPTTLDRLSDQQSDQQQTDPFSRPRRDLADRLGERDTQAPETSPPGEATRGRRRRPRGRSTGDGDPEQGDDAEPSHRRSPPPPRSQLLLKSVPIALFSRSAIQRHFSALQNVQITYVSLRGSRRPDSRRTALVTFADERQAAAALRDAPVFRGIPLQLALYRAGGATPAEQGESNELFFNNVPESLFSEDGVTDLFDSISGGGVVRVSLKEKPFYGAVKRTAIITFKSVDTAAKALQNLPLYKGRSLTVSFRRTRPGTSGAVNPTGDGADDLDMAYVKGYVKEEQQEYYNTEDEIQPRFGRGASQEPGYAQDHDNDHNLDPETEYDDYQAHRFGPADREEEQEQSSRSKAAEMQAEMARLRAAIEKKKKERSLMTQSDKAKREKKLMVPKRRDAASVEQDARGGWRKVGEKVHFKNAMNFVGTCMTMCPFKEFQDRIVQRDISVFEKDEDGEPSFELAVKKYRRSAAISEQPSPNEVRPPKMLLATMKHLMNICDSTDAKFADVHNFVRDRTRSLRQDFTLQGVRDESCIKIHEESVRFHILSEHRLYGTDPTVFSSKQNLEQLDKCLISLREMYDLRRDNDLDTSPNEPEMQAYYMLTQMSDPKTCVQLCTGFSQDVRDSQPVQFALAVVRAASDGFGSFTRYFSLVRSAPYLMACLMHSRFSVVRVRALSIINGTHGNPNSRDTIPISALTRQLGFESEDEAERYCRILGMTVESATLPSTGSQVISVRTPSEDFDEANASKWKASRSDVLIESKAQDMNTSDIIKGHGRDDYKAHALKKKSSDGLKPKEKKPADKQSAPISSLFPQPSSSFEPVSKRHSPALRPPLFTGEPIQPSAKQTFPRPERTTLPTKPTVQLEDYGKRDGSLFRAPDPLSKATAMATIQKRRRSLPGSPKPVPVLPLKPPPALPNPEPPLIAGQVQPGSSTLPSVTRIGPVELPKKETIFLQTPTSSRKTEYYPEEMKEQLTDKPGDKTGIDLGLNGVPTTTTTDEKASAEKLKRAARLSSTISLLTGIIQASETDIKKVQEIIEEVKSRKLRFPKAMTVWDDAKDILLAVSEKSGRGLQELEREGAFEEEESPDDVTSIAELRQKLRFISQEGTELRDQLDEIFSRSLADATATLKEAGFSSAATSLACELVSTDERPRVTPPFVFEDEDGSPFDIPELPDSGSEVHAAVASIRTTGLPKWQAVIAPLVSRQTGRSEMSIAQRWVRQRLAVNPDFESGSLCLFDAKESGSASISIREVKQISSIPYTADLVVLPCDISEIGSDMSVVLTSLGQVLRKNRSIALSYNMPPPAVVILYYCGTNDMPEWLTCANTSKSFAGFQKMTEEKMYVTICRKLELPRSSAFRDAQCETFTDMMAMSVRIAVQEFTKLEAKPIMKNLRDHLVHVANNALRAVLGSQFHCDDEKTFLQCIHDINESWKAVARDLRREEARWPREMAERQRILDAFTTIESHLKLPLPNALPVSGYIRDMAVYVGLGMPTSQELEGAFWFSSALCHLMDAFVRRKLRDCSASVVYLPPQARIGLKKSVKPALTCALEPVRLENGQKALHSRYISRTLQKRGVRTSPKSLDTVDNNQIEESRNPKRAKLVRKAHTKMAGDFVDQKQSSTANFHMQSAVVKNITKQRPDNDTTQNRDDRLSNPMRRRLSFSAAEPIQEDREAINFVSNRRQSLPVSYGRRRMHEMLDSICREGDKFDKLIQTTMDALVAKRRRLEQHEVLAS